MRILFVITGLALALTACGADAAAPTSAPPAGTPTATAALGVDSACDDPGLREFLDGIQAGHERGAFDPDSVARLDPDDVNVWRVKLAAAEHAADLPLYKALVSVDDALESYALEDPDSVTIPILSFTIKISASTVATVCHLDDGYTFTQS